MRPMKLLVAGIVIGLLLALGGSVLAHRDPEPAPVTQAVKVADAPVRKLGAAESAQLAEVMERVQREYVDDIEQPALIDDALRGLAMFQKLGVPILGMVENMSTFVCPCCGHAEPIFGSGGALRVAEQLGVPLLGTLPLIPAIRAGGDSGRPAAAEHDTPQAAAFDRLVEAVLEAIPQRVAPASAGGIPSDRS